jgi:signal peptidase I
MKIEKLNSQRNPKIALALSLIMPGLGQVYNGEIAKGLSLFLIFAFAIPACIWLGMQISVLLSLLALMGVLITVFIYGLCVMDAFKMAKRIGPHFQLGPANRPYVYLAILFFGYFFVLLQLSEYTQTHLAQFFTVPSKSMVPNVLQGDYFFADKRVNSPGAKHSIKRGDVGIFVYPNDRTTIYIKRIVGMPGDKIEITANDLTVNGKSIRGEQVSALGSDELNQLLVDHNAYLEKAESGEVYPVLWKKNSQQQTISVTVPDGYVYLLGDNRDESMDSRKFGPVPLTDVIGIAKQVMFSASADAGFRVFRIGKNVQIN